MNNLPDEDPKLTNFLRQNHAIAPAGKSELEDRLMSEINALPLDRQYLISRSWRRNIVGIIGLIITGIIGTTIFQLVNPPEPSIAELDSLNLYLEANLPELIGNPDSDAGKYEDLGDLDDDLF